LVISDDYGKYFETEVEPSEPVIAIFCYVIQRPLILRLLQPIMILLHEIGFIHDHSPYTSYY